MGSTTLTSRGLLEKFQESLFEDFLLQMILLLSSKQIIIIIYLYYFKGVGKEGAGGGVGGGGGGGANGVFFGVEIFTIKKLLKFSVVINVQAILGGTQWSCSGKKGFLKNSRSELKKNFQVTIVTRIFSH